LVRWVFWSIEFLSTTSPHVAPGRKIIERTKTGQSKWKSGSCVQTHGHKHSNGFVIGRKLTERYHTVTTMSPLSPHRYCHHTLTTLHSTTRSSHCHRTVALTIIVATMSAHCHHTALLPLYHNVTTVTFHNVATMWPQCHHAATTLPPHVTTLSPQCYHPVTTMSPHCSCYHTV
jgi:hypothetical protein